MLLPLHFSPDIPEADKPREHEVISPGGGRFHAVTEGLTDRPEPSSAVRLRTYPRRKLRTVRTPIPSIG